MPPKRQKVKPAEAALPKKIRKSLSLADKKDLQYSDISDPD